MLFQKGCRSRHQTRQISVQSIGSKVSDKLENLSAGKINIKEKKSMKSLANKIVVLFVLVVLLTSVVFTQPNDLPIIGKSKGQYTTVLSIPIGSDLKYENDGLEEIEKVGPSSFGINSKGEFLIADTPTNRILWFSPDGIKINEVTVEGAVGITDIEIKDGEIYALDTSAVEPVVFRLSEAGAILEKISVPVSIRDEGLTGIKIGNGGELVFEMKDGADFVDNAGNSISESVSALASIKTPLSAQESLSDNKAELSVSGKKFEDIHVQNYLGGLQPLAVTNDGDVFIAVTEVVSLPTIYVDETIRRYDKNGNLLGIARVPINESYVYIQNNVVVTEQGDVFALAARQKSLDIVKLKFKRNLNPILPDESKFRDPATESAMQNAVACSISRDQIMANANAYINNSIYLSNANINGACSGRTKPRYLGSAGTKSSVPYDWGGNDSVSQYNSFMSQGYQAGDIPIYSTGVESCSRGVDCSGYVGRTFGLSTKYSTSTLPNISSAITRENLQPGDMINREGDHVVLFDSFGSNGVTAWESTVNGNVDRVVRAFSQWTRLNGYTPRRYNNVCVGSFTLSSSPVTITVTRGSTAFFNPYAYTNNGFRGAVNFYALNLPGQVLSGTGFTPTSVDVRNNGTWYGTTLKIVTNSSTPRGYFPITVEGRSGSGTVRTTVYLNVL